MNEAKKAYHHDFFSLLIMHLHYLHFFSNHSHDFAIKS